MSLKEIVGGTIAAKKGWIGTVDKKVNEWLDDYKKATAALETFGFKVGKVSIGMGMLPEIHTSITGSIDNIHDDKLGKMIEEHKSETLLVSLLNALIMTKRIKEHVELKLTGVTLLVTFGVPPKVEVEMH